AMAQIVEHYGQLEALAGGSSASVSMFLYESMRMNPTIEAADDELKPVMMALMLKSFYGSIEVFKNSPLAASLTMAIEIAKDPKILFAVDFPKEQWMKAGVALAEALQNPNYRTLINPNIFAMLRNEDHLGYSSHEFKVNEIMETVRGFGKFTATDRKMFFREGLLNFSEVAATIGLMGDFYAGRGVSVAANLGPFLNQCGTRALSVGKTWPEIGDRKTSSGKTCRELFQFAANSFHTDLKNRPDKALSSRLKERAGAHTPVLASTSIVDGELASKQFYAADNLYKSGKNPELPKDFFDSVKFGYWLPAPYETRIVSEVKKFSDGKSRKFANLGTQGSWRDVLERSPAEPGLSRFVPISANRLSVGGWSDLHPVQVLRAAGCRKIFYVTRAGEESTFTVSSGPIDGTRPPQGLAELLGINVTDRKEIFDVNNIDSGFGTALEEANAVWCTKWSDYGDLETLAMMNQASKPAIGCSSKKRK
ncbi:MAG: hypothetical protein NTV34_12965, partial [Proteobacteria bacterium]|nr:hypothetical protein [Pseudomonadota bacterium]